MSELTTGSSNGLYADLTGRIIGAAIEVQRRLGPGLLESTYEHALGVELDHLAVPYQRQVTIPIVYRGHLVGEYRLDLVVDERVVVELKAVTELVDLHVAQTLAYLRAGRFRIGLLLNFNSVPLTPRGLRRIAL